MKSNTAKVKFCWKATETKNGYRLTLCLGSKDYNLKGMVVKTEKDISNILEKGAIVFVHLKNHK